MRPPSISDITTCSAQSTAKYFTSKHHSTSCANTTTCDGPTHRRAVKHAAGRLFAPGTAAHGPPALWSRLGVHLRAHSSSIWRTGSAKASRARWAPATGPCIRPRACDPPAPSQTVRASRMPARKVLTAGFDPGPDMSRVVHHFVVTTVGKTPDVGAGDLHAAEHRIDSLSHGGAMRSARLSWG